MNNNIDLSLVIEEPSLDQKLRQQFASISTLEWIVNRWVTLSNQWACDGGDLEYLQRIIQERIDAYYAVAPSITFKDITIALPDIFWESWNITDPTNLISLFSKLDLSTFPHNTNPEDILKTLGFYIWSQKDNNPRAISIGMTVLLVRLNGSRIILEPNQQ